MRVKFLRVDQMDDADIRIVISDSSWSEIGTDAKTLEKGQPTMGLSLEDLEHSRHIVCCSSRLANNCSSRFYDNLVMRSHWDTRISVRSLALAARASTRRSCTTTSSARAV